MPLDIDPQTSEHLQQLKGQFPFIWLFEIETKEVPAQRLRITNFTELVPFGEDSNGSPILYYPTPVLIGGIRADSDRGLPVLELTVGIAGPVASALVDQSDGFVGQPVRILLVDSQALEQGQAIIEENGSVSAATITTEGMAFEVSAGNPFLRDLPDILYSRDYCTKWVGDFGGAGCGYNLNAFGAGFVQCGQRVDGTFVALPFTLDACTLVGDDEEANANVGSRQHPQRFGGFPGMRDNR